MRSIFFILGCLFFCSPTMAGGLTFERIVDIGKGDEGSYPKQGVTSADSFYFLAKTNSQHQLFKLDSKTELPNQVMDINFPIKLDSLYPDGDGGVFIFGTYEKEKALFHHDGSGNGFSVVLTKEDIGYTIPTEMVKSGDYFYYTDFNQMNGREIWRTDGTKAGTKLVHGPPDESNVLSVKGLMPFGDSLIYITDSTIHGSEVWQTDGTESGTKLINFSGQKKGVYFIDSYTVWNEELYFTDQKKLFKIKDPNMGYEVVLNANYQFRIEGLQSTEAKLFYVVDQKELWAMDSNKSDSELILDVSEISDYIICAGITIHDKYWFSIRTDDHGMEPWVSDGTSEGTKMVKDIYTGPKDSFYSPRLGFNMFHPCGDKVAFFAESEIYGNELFISDGTEEGTQIIKDNAEGKSSFDSYRYPIVGAYKNQVIFPFINPNRGVEPFISDGTFAGTRMLANLNYRNAGSRAYGFTKFKDAIYFSAEDESGSELWKTDGTALGTSKITDVYPGVSSSRPTHITALDNYILFESEDSEFGREIFISDGTSEGTQLLTEISKKHNLIISVIEIEDYIIFPLRPDNKLDSSLISISKKDFSLEILDTEEKKFSIRDIASIGKQAVFSDMNSGGLYVTDGTQKGTELIGRFDPRVEHQLPLPGRMTLPSSPTHLFPLDNGVIFSSSKDGSGLEPYFSDGTTVGSFLIEDIVSGHGNSLPRDYAEVIISSNTDSKKDSNKIAFICLREDEVTDWIYMVDPSDLQKGLVNEFSAEELRDYTDEDLKMITAVKIHGLENGIVVDFQYGGDTKFQSNFEQNNYALLDDNLNFIKIMKHENYFEFDEKLTIENTFASEPISLSNGFSLLSFTTNVGEIFETKNDSETELETKSQIIRHSVIFNPKTGEEYVYETNSSVEGPFLELEQTNTWLVKTDEDGQGDGLYKMTWSPTQ